MPGAVDGLGAIQLQRALAGDLARPRAASARNGGGVVQIEPSAAVNGVGSGDELAVRRAVADLEGAADDRNASPECLAAG